MTDDQKYIVLGWFSVYVNELCTVSPREWQLAIALAESISAPADVQKILRDGLQRAEEEETLPH